jgi:hypothetical protein
VHGAYYEVRPPGLDGTGEISLRDLVKFVLAICRFSYPFRGLGLRRVGGDDVAGRLLFLGPIRGGGGCGLLDGRSTTAG